MKESNARRVILSSFAGTICVIAGALFVFLRVVEGSLERAEIWLEEAETGEARPLTSDGRNFRPAFSPDGMRLIYVHFLGRAHESPTAIRAERSANNAERPVLPWLKALGVS
jgi:hypothetical protein